MSNVYELAPRFADLFDGLHGAFGTGAGRWIKRPLTIVDWVRHLQGDGPGIGVAPLRPDNTVKFAAIDLDEPDFAAAKLMRELIRGQAWVERSRSGNAHIWVFFKEPLEAWIARDILREVLFGANKEYAEIFPKNHDFSRVKYGNYINLPYHGKERPILTSGEGTGYTAPMELKHFLCQAEVTKVDPEKWRHNASMLQLVSPEQRERQAEFGTQKTLHICAEHIIATADENPVVEGHRAVVYFCLAKQITNCEQFDHDEALILLQSVNEASPDPISELELRRILTNAERGEYTSTGCDDPLFAQYAHPDCPIAHSRS